MTNASARASRKFATASFIGLVIGLAATPARARTIDPVADPAPVSEQEIVVLGTRRSGVDQLDAPAPVDAMYCGSAVLLFRRTLPSC